MCVLQVPGFCFGEKWVHESILLPKPLRELLYKKFRLAGQLLRGRFYITFLGHVVQADGLTPLTLGFVWWAPIRVRHEPNPSDEYVGTITSLILLRDSDLSPPRAPDLAPISFSHSEKR